MELHHVLTEAAWQQALARGRHAPPESGEEGPALLPAGALAFVLKRHFSGVPDLLVLTFEADDVAAPVRWVASEPDQPPFPHLYGVIPCAAVRRVAAP